MLQDALHLQDVSEPETTLEADLCDSSNRVFHGAVARFQASQQKRFEQADAELQKWIDQQLALPGCNKEQIMWMAAEHLKKIRLKLHQETAQYMVHCRTEEAQRNESIRLFILLGRNPLPDND